jgi:hypothetical protein
VSPVLRRLVADAAGVERSVHPLLGSLFQHSSTPEMSEVSLRDAVAESPVEVRSRRIDAIPPADAVLPRGTGHGEPSPAERASGVRPAAAAHLMPTEHELGRRPPAMQPEALFKSPGAAAVPSTNESNREPARLIVPASEPVVRSSPQVLMDSPRPERISSNLRRPHDAPQSDALQPRAVRRDWRATPARSEASRDEEVQIHIGRIEVLAVPPPVAARAAAAAPLRSTKLADYLQRGHGKSR